MLTITGYRTRESQDGKSFVQLRLEGGLAMVQSQNSGKFYATVRKAHISTTFDEAMAEKMIGTEIPGQINREICDPYTITKDTGEEMTFDFRWVYSPIEEVVESGVLV